MEYLAIELLEQIFTLACTDGGYTGCSLSLVSKHIRDTSRASRFYSISLTSGSAHQATQFLDCFTAQRALSEAVTPRVRHLCLTSATREAKVYSRPKAEDDKEQLAFSADLTSLFRIVAPELYTLCLVHGHRLWPKELRFPNFGCTKFPLLRELAIVGSGMKYAAADEMWDDGTSSCMPLPRLSRLHLTYTFTGVRTCVDLACWATRAPGITHLRISNLDYYASGIVAQLKAAVVETKAPDDAGAAARMFPNLEQVLMQPHARPAPGGRCGTPYIKYAEYMDMLQRLCQTGSRSFELLPVTKSAEDSYSEETHFRDDAKREWMDRIDGGAGCWQVGSSACM